MVPFNDTQILTAQGVAPINSRATPGFMKKERKNKTLVPKSEELRIGPDGDKYLEYLKKHNKELRRLERELQGKNTYEPPDGDY